MTHVVIVYLNVEKDAFERPAGMLDGYAPGHKVLPVFAYATDHTDPLNEAFELFNAPEDYLSELGQKIQRRYYANGLRSLSVGDVVQVDGQLSAVARFGWDDVPAGSLRVTASPGDLFPG
jgi:hypothetical protein